MRLQVEALDWVALPAARDATVLLDGREVDSATGSLNDLPLRRRSRQVAVVVTSPDQRRRATYVVHVRRLAPWET